MAPNRFYSSTAQEAQLTADITNVATTMSVDGVSGFPTQFPYTLGIEVGSAQQEVVTVTNAVGTTLTVTRGQDGTAAISHVMGATVTHIHSARDFREPQEHLGESANVHSVGVGNDVVGTGTSQVLTDKDLTDSSNSFPASLATTTGGHTAKTGDGKLKFGTVAASPTVIDNGWLKCDGGAVSRTTFAALFAYLGTTYGAGDGSTTFNIPDMRGRVPIGIGTYKSLGGNEGKIEANRDLGHTHSIGTGGSHSHSIANANMGGDNTMQGGGNQGRLFNSTENKEHNHNGSTGPNGDHDHTGSTGNSVADPISHQAIHFLIKT